MTEQEIIQRTARQIYMIQVKHRGPSHRKQLEALLEQMAAELRELWIKAATAELEAEPKPRYLSTSSGLIRLPDAGRAKPGDAIAGG
jgi:hypothetical protein